MKNVKPAKTIKEQIQILQQKGVLISDSSFAENVLLSINYYTFSGYLFDFRDANGKYNNIHFEKIFQIYQCDKRIRSVLLYAIETVEHNIKTKLAYFLVHKTSPLGYLDPNHFKNLDEHKKMIYRFTQNVNNNNRIPFVKHHIIKYDSFFPFWVAIELFTFGMVWNCYKNLKTPYKKGIASFFNTGSNQLESWIECISYLRNMAAHDMRLYNFNIQKTPRHCKKNFANFQQSNKIFDLVYAMKLVAPDQKEWNEFILSSIASIFHDYEEYIDISCYGFPENWETILKI